MAQQFGIEKLVLKQRKMVCHFSSNPDHPFYHSPHFAQLIRYAQSHSDTVHLRETTERLTLVCDNVADIRQAIAVVSELKD